MTDFKISKKFIKFLKTNTIETVKARQEFFCCQLPSVQLSKRINKFVLKFNGSSSRPTK